MNRDPKHHDHHAPGPPDGKWRPHHDWRVWVAVLLMLAAIIVYVLTLDESWWPARGG